MIRYRVVCEHGHGFEAWFASSAAFDEQAGRGHVACPECGSTAVQRGLMAPAVRSSRKREEAAPGTARTAEVAAANTATAAGGANTRTAPAEANTGTAAAGNPSPEPAGESGSPPAAPGDAVRLARLEAAQKAYVEAIRRLRTHIVANATDVGTAFPEEARKIHYGEAEARGIYGKASPEEARELVEEGIDVTPFPHLPEDAH